MTEDQRDEELPAGAYRDEDGFLHININDLDGGRHWLSKERGDPPGEKPGEEEPPAEEPPTPPRVKPSPFRRP